MLGDWKAEDMKKTLALAAGVLLTVSLAACGGSGSSSSGDYCDLLKDAKSDVDTSDFTTLTDAKFNDLVDQIHAVEESAPSDVQDDWKTFGDVLDQFQSILSDAGISFDDLSSLQSGQLPDGVDMAKLQEAMKKLQSLDTDSLTEAQQNIADNAKSECDITIDTTS